MVGTTIRPIIEVRAWEEGLDRMVSTQRQAESDRRWLEELDFITITEPDGAGSFGAL